MEDPFLRYEMDAVLEDMEDPFARFAADSDDNSDDGDNDSDAGDGDDSDTEAADAQEEEEADAQEHGANDEDEDDDDEAFAEMLAARDAVHRDLAGQFLRATNGRVSLPSDYDNTNSLYSSQQLVVYRLRKGISITDFATAIQMKTVDDPNNNIDRIAFYRAAFFIIRMDTDDTDALLVVNAIRYPKIIPLSDGYVFECSALRMDCKAGNMHYGCSVYFPRGRPRLWAQELPVHDTALKFICYLALFIRRTVVPRMEYNAKTQLCIGAIKGYKLALHNLFSRELWTSCLKEQSSVWFQNIVLADWQWEAIQNVPFDTFKCTPVSPQFLQHTPAKSIEVSSLDTEQKLAIANRKQDSPIPSLKVYLAYDTVEEEAEEWLRLLERVQMLYYGEPLYDTRIRHPWEWQTFWSGLRNNSTVTELYFSRGRTEGPPRPTCVRTMGYIHACLQENWFIETICLCNCDSDAVLYRDAHIEPLLELNKSHQPRISHNESQPAVLMDALLRVHRHTTKSYLFLKTFHHALFPKADSSKRRHDGEVEVDGSRKRVCTAQDNSTA